MSGIQLSSLSNAGKDQLARFVAERKVVVFRDQDFADLPIEKALEFGGYFGRHHMHPTSGSPEGFPEVHLVFRGVEDKTSENFYKTRTSSVAWYVSLDVVIFRQSCLLILLFEQAFRCELRGATTRDHILIYPGQA